MKLLRGTMRMLTILFLLMMKGMDGPPLTERPNTGQQVIINATAGENKLLMTKDESAQKDILTFQWFFRKASTTKEVTYCQDISGNTERCDVPSSYSSKVERCNATSILLKNISSHDEGYYRLNVLKNRVVKAENFTIFLSVSGVPQPVQVTSHRDSPGSTSYQLMWDKPDDGGSPLIKYIILYCQVEIKPNGTEYELSKPLSQFVTVERSPSDVSYTLSPLKPGSYYQVEVQAVNTVGKSSKRFIFKTKETPDNPGSNMYFLLFLILIIPGLFICVLCRKKILSCTPMCRDTNTSNPSSSVNAGTPMLQDTDTSNPSSSVNAGAPNQAVEEGETGSKHQKQPKKDKMDKPRDDETFRNDDEELQLQEARWHTDPL